MAPEQGPIGVYDPEELELYLLGLTEAEIQYRLILKTFVNSAVLILENFDLFWHLANDL